MRLCGPRVVGYPADREHALAVLRRAVELGITLVDTSDAYGPEVNELQIAEALHPYPAGLVIATKGGNTRRRTGQWIPDGRPAQLRAACEASLRRLRLERIDLYQLHTVDPNVPIEESVGELARLQGDGKIRHIGVSNVDAAELARARTVAPIASVQNRFSVASRANEDVLRVCQRDGLAFLAWYPLDAGRLVATGGPLERVALAHGVTTAQVALAWLLQHSPAVAPIPGTSSLAHLEENVAAAALRLERDEVASLDGVF